MRGTLSLMTGLILTTALVGNAEAQVPKATVTHASARAEYKALVRGHSSLRAVQVKKSIGPAAVLTTVAVGAVGAGLLMGPAPLVLTTASGGILSGILAPAGRDYVRTEVARAAVREGKLTADQANRWASVRFINPSWMLRLDRK